MDYSEFLRHFTCRLVLFGYTEPTKDPTKGMREFASVPLRPPLADTPGGYEKVVLIRKLRSQDNGASEIEKGVGLAMVVEKTTAGAGASPPGLARSCGSTT